MLTFFFGTTLDRDWKIFDFIRSIKDEKKIPTVIEKSEVQSILNSIRTQHNYVYFLLVYSCGLRASEAVNLKPENIDSKRMKVTIVKGKGKRTREVPLPKFTLDKLREYWATHRNPNFIFPAVGKSMKDGSDSKRPMLLSSVRDALRKVVAELNTKKHVTTHTFRHCYATHLLDEGVNLRLVQLFLGHESITTTCKYLHVTSFGLENVTSVMNNIFDKKLDNKKGDNDA